MKRLKAEDALLEVKCSACNGTGFPNVKQPVEPRRRIFPAPCREGGGARGVTRSKMSRCR
jgi:hypothetical protein